MASILAAFELASPLDKKGCEVPPQEAYVTHAHVVK